MYAYFMPSHKYKIIYSTILHNHYNFQSIIKHMKNRNLFNNRNLLNKVFIIYTVFNTFWKTLFIENRKFSSRKKYSLLGSWVRTCEKVPWNFHKLICVLKTRVFRTLLQKNTVVTLVPQIIFLNFEGIKKCGKVVTWEKDNDVEYIKRGDLRWSLTMGPRWLPCSAVM